MFENEVITADTGGTFTPIPTGIHAFECIGLFICGTIEGSYNGKPKINKKLVLEYELVNTAHVFKEEEGPKPFTIRRSYTYSLGKNSTLRKVLGDWRGAKLTDKEADDFNLVKVLGKPGSFNIIHDVKDGKTVAEIAAFLPPMPNTPKAKQPLRLFNIYKQPFDTATFETLPPWVQEMIKSSQEYKKLTVNTPAQSAIPADSVNPFATTITADSATKMF